MKFVLSLVLLALPLSALAQDAPPSVLPQRAPEAGGDLLGQQFQSQSAGIALRVPAGCVVARRNADDFADFADPQRGWSLTMSELRQSKPIALGTGDDSNLIAIRAQQFRDASPGAQILRADKINIGKADVGMVAVRAPIGLGWRLTQQAIVQADEKDYYIITLTSPGGKPPAQGEQADVDPREKLAVDTFSAMLDTVKLLDREAFHDDQVLRLFETHSLFLNFTPQRLTQALVPAQTYRIIQDGNEVGTSTITETVEKRSKWNGFVINIRTNRATKDVSANGESQLFSSFDRTHEEWTSVVTIRDQKSTPQKATEVGICDRDDKPMKNPENPKAPRIVEGYDLSVSGSQSDKPLTRDMLPAYYVQQALVQMFPRLLPLDKPRKFMIACYVPEQREVMLRYYDVEEMRDVNLGGRRVTAVPILDRVGYDSPPTIHYISPTGQYLGSVNAEAKVTVLAVETPGQ